MAKGVPPLGQAAAPAHRAIAALPSDEQTVYCPTAYRSQKREDKCVSLAENDYLCSRNPKSTIMTAITINVPNHEVSFFKKLMVKMGWTYSEADVVRSVATPKEKALAKVDHAFGQLRQMKDDQLQGVNAEDLLNEL